MGQNQLEKDLPNITIIFSIICFIILYFQGVYFEHKHSKEVARLHNMTENVLEIAEQQKAEIEALDKGLQAMDSYIEYLEERISQVSELEKILKDLERSWIRK
jgi:uncharacterized protein YacL